MNEDKDLIPLQGHDLDPLALEEKVGASIIGFRFNPHRGPYLAISVLRSAYEENTMMVIELSHAERTRAQLQVLGINEVVPIVEFFAFACGYLSARLFMPSLGEGPVLSRLVYPDAQIVDETAKRQSIERSTSYMNAISELHDNRAAPRDSQLVLRFLSQYLAMVLEDPRMATLEALLGSESVNPTGNTPSTARFSADILDCAHLWATLGWRRGQAERRFQLGSRQRYLENLAGDVRIIFDSDRRHVQFSDIRRVRIFDRQKLFENPHPCDDENILRWIAENCAMAENLWHSPQ